MSRANMPYLRQPLGEWAEDAACLNADPDLFFPSIYDPNVADGAKAICAQCPVREDCLSYALTNRVEYGIWGGMNADERRTFLRRNPHAGRTYGLLGASEAAKRAGVTRRSMSRAAAEGRIPSRMYRNRLYFHPRDVDDFRRQRQEGAA